MVSIRLLGTSLALFVAVLLVGCAEVSPDLAPADGVSQQGIELGQLTVEFDVASGEVTGSFTPTPEAAARYDASSLLSGVFGKSVYDNRNDIRELRPAGSTTAVGRGAILGVSLKNASAYHFLGLRWQMSWASNTNQIYALDASGNRIATEVAPYDPEPETGSGPGRNFLVANDSSQIVPADYAYVQSTEFAAVGYRKFTELDATNKVGVWRFPEVDEGASNLIADCYGPPWLDAGGIRQESTDDNVVGVALVFALPPGTKRLITSGTLYADCAVVTNASGGDTTDITTALTGQIGSMDRDASGRLYVTSGTQVQRLNADGSLQQADLLQSGITRSRLGHIAVVGAPYNKIYVVDTNGIIRIYDNTAVPSTEITTFTVANAFGIAVDPANSRLFVSQNVLGTNADGKVNVYPLTSGGVPSSTTATATVNVNLGTDDALRPEAAGGTLDVDSSGNVYVAAQAGGILRYAGDLSALQLTYQTNGKVGWGATPGHYVQFAVLSDDTLVAYDRAGVIPDAVFTGDSTTNVIGDNGPLMFARTSSAQTVGGRSGFVRFATDGSVISASRLWTYYGATQTHFIPWTAGGTSPIAIVPEGAGAGGSCARAVLLYDPALAAPGSGQIFRFDM